MNARKWAIISVVWMLISILFSIIFFITHNIAFTEIAWVFIMCELFSVIKLMRCMRKEDNAANDI